MIAYVARELGTGRTLSAHDDVQLPAYSTIKVLLAAAFWRMVAAGELDEAEPYCFEPGAAWAGAACCAACGTPPSSASPTHATSRSW